MVVVVIALFAGVFWVTIPALNDAVRRQLSLQPFAESQDTATQGLIDLGQTITSDNDFLALMRRDLRPIQNLLHQESDSGRNPEKLLTPDKELLERLQILRAKNLRSLWDQATRLLLRAEVTNEEAGQLGFASKADLLVVLDREGAVLFELSTQHNPKQPEQLGRLAITFPLRDNTIQAPTRLYLDLPLVNAALDGMDEDSDNIRSFVSYQKYPDGQLYNMVAVPFQDNGKHLLLLGKRVDMLTAFHATGPNTAVLILVDGRYENGYRRPEAREQWSEQSLDGRLGSLSDAVPETGGGFLPGPYVLGPALVKAAEEGRLPWLPLRGEVSDDYEPGLRDVTLADESFVSLAHPFLDQPREVQNQAPLAIGQNSLDEQSKPIVEKAPVLGWLVLLKPTREVTRAANSQQIFILAVGLLAALLAAALAGPFSRHITGPILVLARKMRAVVEKGDLTPAEPAGSREIAEASESFNQMVAGLRQKDVLEKFVPEETRAEVAQEGRLVLGQAQRVTATVMFSDLRGFTGLSERLDPSELVGILGEYLRRMTRVVLENNGSIYEYIGDAIMAVFRDKDGVDGAEQAVRASLAMYRELREFQASSSDREVQTLRQGIGLNTGLLVDGNIGMEARAKRAVIGDVVNLAARIQDRARDGKHTDILVSESTYERVKTRFAFEFFGNELFKGKSHAEPVWEVLDGPPLPDMKKAPLESGDAVGQHPQGRDQ